MKALLLLLISILTLCCSTYIQDPKISVKDQGLFQAESAEIITASSYSCDGFVCKPKELNNTKHYKGIGWEITLSDKWDFSSAGRNFNAVFNSKSGPVKTSVKVKEHDDPCPWKFVKKITDELSNVVEITGHNMVQIGEANHAVLFFSTGDNIGIKMLTAFNKKGYIITCYGKAYTREDVVVILDVCSEFANGLKFETSSHSK